MGAFQLIFIAINIAFPVWLWTRTSHDKAAFNWNAIDKTQARLIESDQGFPGCDTLRVVDVLHKLCQTSKERLDNGKPMAIEEASPHVVFACEVRNDNINIGWRLENSSDGTLECGDPGGNIIDRGPSFNLTPQGQMRSIEFWGKDNDHEVVPYRNCKLKAAAIKAIHNSPSLDSFLEQVGRIDKDPRDYKTANLMCLTFDSSATWKPWRQKFLQ